MASLWFCLHSIFAHSVCLFPISGSLRTVRSRPFSHRFTRLLSMLLQCFYFNSLFKIHTMWVKFLCIKIIIISQALRFFFLSSKQKKHFRKMFICLLIFGAALVNRALGCVVCCAILLVVRETRCVYKKCFAISFIIWQSYRSQKDNDRDNNRGSLSVLVFVICNYSLFLRVVRWVGRATVVVVVAAVTVVVCCFFSVLFVCHWQPSSSLIILNNARWLQDIWNQIVTVKWDCCSCSSISIRRGIFSLPFSMSSSHPVHGNRFHFAYDEKQKRTFNAI